MNKIYQITHTLPQEHLPSEGLNSPQGTGDFCFCGGFSFKGVLYGRK